jgi:hypothetical protein
LIDQVTAVVVVLLTVAVNCWLWVELRLTDAGLTPTETAAAGMRVTAAFADMAALALEVAVTVTACCAVTLLGAEYLPLAEIVPTEGLTDQVTAVLLVLVHVAVNCWL